ncbi:MAG: peptide deformylase [Patescibacteria group bacterium]
MNEYFIRQKADPILRQLAVAVDEPLPNPKVQAIIRSMSQVLEAEKDGVALAAPQIGLAVRIFIISPRVLPDRKTDLVFINPRIVKRSRRCVELVEGCLSVRQLYGKIKRHEKVTVEAQDENGQRFTRHTSGLLAQIVQHEIDHLDGQLFTDRARELEELPPPPDEH